MAVHDHGWRFVALDPSAPTLEVCRRRAAEAGFADRCEFRTGFLHELRAGGAVRHGDGNPRLAVHHRSDVTHGVFRGNARRLRPDEVLITTDLTKAPAGQHACWSSGPR